MAKGYWIVQSDIHDMDRHAEYTKANRHILRQFGAKFVVRWGQQQIPEGKARGRQIVIEFPDFASAVECYNHPEYQAAHDFRIGTTDSDMIIVEGYDGPQP